MQGVLRVNALRGLSLGSKRALFERALRAPRGLTLEGTSLCFSLRLDLRCVFPVDIRMRGVTNERITATGLFGMLTRRTGAVIIERRRVLLLRVLITFHNAGVRFPKRYFFPLGVSPRQSWDHLAIFPLTKRHVLEGRLRAIRNPLALKILA